MSKEFFSTSQVYFGDLHNHCGISYGHGPLEDSLANAQLQLDFVAITGHAAWPDMLDQPIPQEVVDYHKAGFDSLRRAWSHYSALMEQANQEGKFVTFPSYEIHSFRYGDRTLISAQPIESIQTPDTPEELETYLNTVNSETDSVLLIPHHIGYKQGFRGVNWDSITEAASPIIEIVSMHGLADDTSGFPYLHTMGPLHGMNAYMEGLKRGLHLGLIGSTDHHSAHPGSYGYGKLGVWSSALSREAIWEALQQRRTYALTGDRIWLEFSVNDEPLGTILEPSDTRTIVVNAQASNEIDRVEIYKNGLMIDRYSPALERYTAMPARYNSTLAKHTPALARHTATLDSNSIKQSHTSVLDHSSASGSENLSQGSSKSLSQHRSYSEGQPQVVEGYVCIEFGWGEKNQITSWDGTVECIHGTILSVEPRFRGKDVVDPLETGDGLYKISSWSQENDHLVRFSTVTFGNTTTTTSQTQAITFKVTGHLNTIIACNVMNQRFEVALTDITHGAETFYTNGFVSPAIRFHQFIPLDVTKVSYVLEDRCSYDHDDSTGSVSPNNPKNVESKTFVGNGQQEDWYLVKIILVNGHLAISTPVWVKK